ncbi:hypothetical protein [Actinoplanes sp. TFC3]|uniref:hypothetical protein n=1 Tax=Actinoplanes sp. TFC3 TaxID=1710355 RepID=UPI00137A4904
MRPLWQVCQKKIAAAPAVGGIEQLALLRDTDGRASKQRRRAIGTQLRVTLIS